MEDIINAAVPVSRWEPIDDDTGFGVWEDASGAALWIQIDDGLLVGAQPFLYTAERHLLQVEGVGEDGRLDGHLHAFLLPGRNTLLPLDVINWPHVARCLRPQVTCYARITAFAEALSVWPGEDAYHGTHPEARHRGAKWVAPTGLFPPEKGGTGRATARITGLVQCASRLTNGFTGTPFLHLRLETVSATLDLVAPDGPPPPPGAVVEGHFWMAALVDPAGLAP